MKHALPLYYRGFRRPLSCVCVRAFVCSFFAATFFSRLGGNQPPIHCYVTTIHYLVQDGVRGFLRALRHPHPAAKGAQDGGRKVWTTDNQLRRLLLLLLLLLSYLLLANASEAYVQVCILPPPPALTYCVPDTYINTPLISISLLLFEFG